MGVLAWRDAVDIGGGRGRLARDAAASLARVDIAMRSAFGRAADINEAWRSPEAADENYRKYLAYLRGGPWAPIALPGDKSVHCFGYALDTDDTSDAHMRIWNDHGWFWTVYRNGKLAERWHLEYFANRDNHRNDPAPASTIVAPIPSEEDDMLALKINAGSRGTHLAVLGLGVFRHLVKEDNPERIKNIVRSDDQWLETTTEELPVLLRTYGCDLNIWDIRNGAFCVLNPDDGSVKPGNMWHR